MLCRFASGSRLAALCLVLAACDGPPDLGRSDFGAAAGNDADWPEIVPVNQALAEAGGLTIDAATATSLEARAEALRRRAAALRARQPDR